MFGESGGKSGQADPLLRQCWRASTLPPLKTIKETEYQPDSDSSDASESFERIDLVVETGSQNESSQELTRNHKFVTFISTEVN